jgi:hypothetical protein
MVDTPDRPHPRFPPSEVPRVADEIRTALERWAVGPGTTLITGGARGADILAAEAAHARGAGIRLILALPPDTFVQGSVALPGTDWQRRFYELLDVADTEVVGGSDDEVYARTNDRILAVARAIETRPHAIVVWNGRTGDGPGGTGDFVAKLRRASGEAGLVLIDPTPA